MIGNNVYILGVRWVLAFIAAAMFALAGSSAAIAQQGDQYDGTVAPSGPVAGETATVQGDDDGVVGPGDTLVIEGDFEVSEGASVTLQDSDGTQGTLIDGQNAEITEGSIIIQVTGEPAGVTGGDGVLDTAGLFVVATTGIAAGDGEAGDGGAGTGVTDTGAATGDGAGAGASAGDGATAQAGTSDGTSAQAGTGDGAEAAAVAGESAVAGAGDGVAEDGAGVAVLPDTGGSIMTFVLAGGLFLLGAGFVIRRLAGNN